MQSRSVTTDYSMPVIQMRKLRLEKHQTWIWKHGSGEKHNQSINKLTI